MGPSGSVIGIEPAFAASVLDTARELAEQQGTSNVSFETGDIHTLEQFEDASFDVVHAHQVLQHIAVRRPRTRRCLFTPDLSLLRPI